MLTRFNFNIPCLAGFVKCSHRAISLSHTRAFKFLSFVNLSKGGCIMSRKKYYQINYFALPEVVDGYGGLLSLYVKEVIQFILSLSKDELKEKLLKIPDKDVEAYYSQAIHRKVYVDELTHRRWYAIPKPHKKRVQYLINQMLLEKLKEVNI
jgi:hypothetical protein